MIENEEFQKRAMVISGLRMLYVSLFVLLLQQTVAAQSFKNALKGRLLGVRRLVGALARGGLAPLR
ncbi:MAG: hypothetical protein AABN95_10280 [Acidobacteriota bacterium]